ncbi:MAG: FAD-dependent oxidoreductase, partial [Candidatus Bathyarchaeia archaeon]
MKVLIIGGNAAGMSAASAVRRLSKESEIVVLEKDAYISYASCSLPYYISDDVKSVEKLFALTADEARRERGIDVRLFKEATEIDIEGKRVIAKDVKSGFLESYDFDKLVIATGASPIIPNFEGVNLKGIFTIRNINDGIAIKNF